MGNRVLAKIKSLIWAAALAVVLIGGPGASGDALAQASVVGPKKCKECHTAEAKVWKGTVHFKSFKTAHKGKGAKKIVKAIGDKRMKKSSTCVLCHYTAVVKKAGKRPKLIAGPSCESCHGPASKWMPIHNDYGKGVKRDAESPEHKAARLKKAEEAGMIRPARLFDVASNCMACHGLANPKLDGKVVTTMLDAGHPLKPTFELVRYSQGTVRHRFYPPDVTENKEMTDAEKSQMYVVGQAAALVSATQAIAKTDNAKYVAAQKARIATATAALNAVKGQVPEAGKLLAAPNAANGRALAEAVKGKDLTGAIGGKLPKDYK